jgi:hypothetical protein
MNIDINSIMNIKNNVHEEIYLLSDIIYNGGCIRCMNKTCKIEEQHGIFFPDILGKYVLNPNYIKGVQIALENTKLEFEGKKKYYTICNYFMHSCNNCKDGRTKSFIFNDKKFTLCFPVLNKSKNKVIIGIHADIELKKKDNEYEINLIPFEMNDKYKTKLNIHENNNITINEYNKIWPSLSNDDESPKSTIIKLNFNNIIKKYNNESLSGSSSFSSLPNYSSSNSLNEFLNNSLEKEEKEKNEENEENEEKLYENFNNNEFINLKKDNDFLKKLCKDLTNEKNKLKNDIIHLEKKISKLKEKNEKNKFIINNNNIYNEILENIKYLNANVTQQFIDTNYSDYLLF